VSETTLLEQLQVGTELAELCRTHAIEGEWLKHSRDLDELLGHVLADCDARLGRLPQRILDADRAGSDHPELDSVRNLVAFVRRAAELKHKAECVPQVVSGVEDLERLNGRCCQASCGDAGRGQDVDTMVELLATLSTLCHKINNPLTSLMGRAQILQMKKDIDPQVSKAVLVIDESARRVAALVQELGQAVCRGKEELLTK
jgi:signal transduction histidine kinase